MNPNDIGLYEERAREYLKSLRKDAYIKLAPEMGKIPRPRVFYTALGHRPEVWQDPAYQQHVAGGISWAMGGQ